MFHCLRSKTHSPQGSPKPLTDHTPSFLPGIFHSVLPGLCRTQAETCSPQSAPPQAPSCALKACSESTTEPHRDQPDSLNHTGLSWSSSSWAPSALQQSCGSSCSPGSSMPTDSRGTQVPLLGGRASGLLSQVGLHCPSDLGH